MSFARLRARLSLDSRTAAPGSRRLYDAISRVPSRSQRDELLVMAQRAES